jgi:hypothetical protein
VIAGPGRKIPGPATIPIEQPIKSEFIANLKTAEQTGHRSFHASIIF